MIFLFNEKENLLFFDLSSGASNIKKVCNMCFEYFQGQTFYYFADKIGERLSFFNKFCGQKMMFTSRIYTISTSQLFDQ